MPFGYWLPRVLKGVDVRKGGSGNIGATNVWRTFGRWYGVPVVLLDVAKGEPWPVVAFASAAALAVLVLHRANLKRLRAGTENRFQLRRKDGPPGREAPAS